MALAISGSRVVVEFGSAKSISLTAGTREAGDGLLVTVWIQSTTQSPSTPSGWTLLGTAARSGSFKEYVYGRIASNTSTDNFTSEWAEAKSRFGEMRRITGKPAAVASWLVGSEANGSGTKATLTGVTTTSAENLLIGIWDTAEAATVKEVSAGWTADGATWTPVVTKTQASAGATGSVEITYTATQSWLGLMVAIPPEGAASSGNPVVMVI